jgi:hypothetical protein
MQDYVCTLGYVRQLRPRLFFLSCLFEERLKLPWMRDTQFSIKPARLSDFVCVGSFLGTMAKIFPIVLWQCQLFLESKCCVIPMS